jgi:enoyl-CoA hydratase
MAFQRLQLHFEGRTARLTLHTDQIDPLALTELAGAADEVLRNGEVSLLLLQPAASDFGAAWSDDAIAQRLQPGAPVDPFAAIAALPIPVVAMLPGTVFSAGLELALCADVRIAAANACFTMPELKQGLLPLGGATQRLPRIAGQGAAASLILLGEQLDAATALRLGLVSRVVPGVDLAAEAGALAQRMAERGPLALRYAKEAVRQGLEMSLDQGLRLELDLSVVLQTTGDRAEGVRAFLAKRRPRFGGR